MAFAVVDDSKLEGTGNVYEIDTTVDYKSLDKSQPEKNFLQKLFSGQLFSFAPQQELNECTQTKSSMDNGYGTYLVYRGGKNEAGGDISAGSKCSTKEHIQYMFWSKVNKRPQKLFDDLWYKSNENDKLYYKNEAHSRENIFNYEDTNSLEMWYNCYRCDVPAKNGCTNPKATNYDKDATNDDGSCQYECIERRGKNNPYKKDYITYKDIKVWDRCSSEGKVLEFICENDKSTFKTYTCPNTYICNDGACIEEEEEEIIVEIFGCTDSTAINYNSEATDEDETCEYDTLPEYDCEIDTDCNVGEFCVLRECVILVNTGDSDDDTVPPTITELLFGLDNYGYYSYAIIGLIFILIIVIIVRSKK